MYASSKTLVILQNMELEVFESQTFGFELQTLTMQLVIIGITLILFVALLTLMILGIRSAVKKTEGTTTALWISVVLLFPFVGPIIAMTCIKPMD